MKQKIIMYLLIGFSAFLVSCGGGGSSNSAPTISISDLVGTYQLTGFTITYSNGTIVNNTNVASFSGSAKIYSSGMYTSTVTVNGVSVGSSGTITILSNSTMSIVNNNGCSYVATFTKNNNVFTISSPMGACGLTSTETHTYVRTSTIASASEEAEKEQ